MIGDWRFWICDTRPYCTTGDWPSSFSGRSTLLPITAKAAAPFHLYFGAISLRRGTFWVTGVSFRLSERKCGDIVRTTCPFHKKHLSFSQKALVLLAKSTCPFRKKHLSFWQKALVLFAKTTCPFYRNVLIFRSLRASTFAQRGNEKQMRAPILGCGWCAEFVEASTQMRPPWASTMARAR